MNEKPTTDRHLKSLFWLSLFLFVGSAALAFAPIQTPPTALFGPGLAPVRHGYTWSLLLFVAPVAALGIWFLLHRRSYAAQLKAFVATATAITLLWSALDVLLANTFFVFPVPEATLGINLPGYTFGHGWEWDVPIEEFVFYATGSAFILLLYLFMSEVWFGKDGPPADAWLRRGETLHRIWQLSFRNLALGAGALLGAWAVKLLFSRFPDHFPGYATFLVALIALPSVAFHRTIGDLINLRAFLVVSLSLSLVALLWEVTLGLPYGYWGYREEQMTGIFLRPWSNLPLEASVLWIAAAWSNVLLFEAVRVIQASPRTAWDLLVSAKGAPGKESGSALSSRGSSSDCEAPRPIAKDSSATRAR
jgi:hypothetical protein